MRNPAVRFLLAVLVTALAAVGATLALYWIWTELLDGAQVSIHGWIYSIRDGLVRDLETTVSDAGEAARLAAPRPLPQRASGLRKASRPAIPRRPGAG